MSDSEPIDPYHLFLGIPPEEQPPDHYQLLGLRQFEPNPDVIESAAIRQIAHVRTFALGQHSAVSQKLLNELARAKVALLNPARRAAYDATLRSKSSVKQPPAPGTILPPPPTGAPQPVVRQVARAVPVSTVAQPALGPLIDTQRTRETTATRRRSSMRNFGLVALGLVLVTIGTAYALSRNGQSTHRPVAQVPSTDPLPSAVPPATSAVISADESATPVPPEPVVEPEIPESSTTVEEPTASTTPTDAATSTQPSPVLAADAPSTPSPPSTEVTYDAPLTVTAGAVVSGVEIQQDMDVRRFVDGAKIRGGSRDLEVQKVPDELRGFLYTDRSHRDGKLLFRMVEPQRVFMAMVKASWGGGGNSSGNWKHEVVKREDFEKQGWQLVTEVETWDPRKEENAAWLVFARDCQAGESFLIRNHKYCAPFMVWGDRLEPPSASSSPD